MIETLVLLAQLTFPLVDPPRNLYEDGTDLGHAMQICSKKEFSSTGMYLVYPPRPAAGDFPPGYENCYNIRQMWWDGEAGKREKEIQKKEDENRLYIQQFGVPKPLDPEPAPLDSQSIIQDFKTK